MHYVQNLRNLRQITTEIVVTRLYSILASPARFSASLIVFLSVFGPYPISRLCRADGRTYIACSCKQPAGLPGSFQFACSFVPEQMDFCNFTFEEIFNRHNRLYEQWLCVSEIQVHYTHHSDSHEGGFHATLELCSVVVLHCRGDERRLFL